MRIQPYSAHVNLTSATFDLFVKVYPDDRSSAGVSAYLGGVSEGESVHVPEIRAWDWRRESRRVGMVCFGVGVTECVVAASALLRAGAEVRMIYANRDMAQAFLLRPLRTLLEAYPRRFRLRHCLSRPASGTNVDVEQRPSVEQGQEHTTLGRVNASVLWEEFGGPWLDGSDAEHFLMVGTTQMERAVLGMLGEAHLVDLSAIRGHPDFLLMKGPLGDNSGWEPLSPHEQEAAAMAKAGQAPLPRTEL